jgi:hypothetical protein
MKPVFKAQKFHRHVVLQHNGAYRGISYREINSPACQYLPGFKIIPPKTPEEWMGRWFTIDF